jgi:hypothetical protein
LERAGDAGDSEGQGFSETVVARNLGSVDSRSGSDRLRGGGAAGSSRYTLVSAFARRPTGRAQ